MNLSPPSSAPPRLCERQFRRCAARVVVLIGMLLVGRDSRCAAEEPPPFAEGRDESAQYEVETVIPQLDDPRGLAVRPAAPRGEPFELFIAETGAGRIVRWSTDAVAEPTDAVAEPVAAITGFPVESEARPLSVDFVSRDWLAVGTGGEQSQVRVYQLLAGGEAIDYDAVDHALGPSGPSERSETGERGFVCLAHQGETFFVAVADGDPRGWVLRATLDSNRLAGLEPFVATRELSGREPPTAVAVNPTPRRHYLVVAQRGAAGDALDSRVTMYSPKSGQLALNLNVGLHDIVGLAYSPAGDLYAIDASQSDGHAAGVYRLEAAQVDGRESCRAVLIVAVAAPTALAFTPDGILYVSASGEANQNAAADDAATGQLLRIKPKADVSPL